MRGVGAGLVPGVLVIGMLTGCSTEPEPEPEPEKAAAGAKDVAEDPAKDAGGDAAEAVKPAVKGGTVGASGSACVLPVSFDLAANWKPEAVEAELTQGTVRLVCEIDAKPAGNIGFIRVWAGGMGGDDARTALEAFVTAEAKTRDKVVYKEIKAGGLAVTEVTYLNTDESLDGPKEEHAFAVKNGPGVVLVHLGGLDSEEHKQMLPAYELAKKSLRAN